MSEGVFQTDREIFSNPIWKNVLKFRLFFYMYGNAVYMEAGKDYGSIHVNRGQILKSYRKLQEALEYIENHAVKQYSLSQIKRAVDELEQEGRITKSETELGTLFTICNYEQYQGFGRFATDSIEQRKNTERTLKEHCWNNNKKDKKEKKEKNNFIMAQNLSMTEEEYNKLVDKYGKEQVDLKIDYARNYKKLKNYTSLYLTVNNWLRRDQLDGPKEKNKWEGMLK